MKKFVVDKIGGLVTMEGVRRKGGRKTESADLAIISDAAMVIDSSKKRSGILWVGKKSDLPSSFKKLRKVSAGGGLVLPGLVDSHTHLIFAGDRSAEFEMRLAGKTYAQIADAGGGIVNTMQSTREAGLKELIRLGQERVAGFLRQGVTTIEIKTGYGLNLESEKTCLSAIEALKKSGPATIKSTFLAAHAIPPEFRGRKSDYVNTVAMEWLPRVRSKCDYVDMFLDEGYFDTQDAQILFGAARNLGIPIKLHADELKLSGGTQTAVKWEALSADHLLKITSEEINLLAGSEVTATLLPTTAFFLKTSYAPARELLKAGARVALATDFNPGTSPTLDVSLVGVLSALQMGMRTEEIISALTYNGACALGLQGSKGALLAGYDADFIILESDSPAGLFYEFGQRPINLKVFAGGTPITLK